MAEKKITIKDALNPTKAANGGLADAILMLELSTCNVSLNTHAHGQLKWE